MNKYKVKLKYGNHGEFKHNSCSENVEAEDESIAAMLAVNKFKNSNAAYKNKDVDVCEIKKI